MEFGLVVLNSPRTDTKALALVDVRFNAISLQREVIGQGEKYFSVLNRATGDVIAVGFLLSPVSSLSQFAFLSSLYRTESSSYAAVDLKLWLPKSCDTDIPIYRIGLEADAYLFCGIGMTDPMPLAPIWDLKKFKRRDPRQGNLAKDRSIFQSNRVLELYTGHR